MFTRRVVVWASLLGAASTVACEGETKTVVASTQLLVSVDFVEALRGQADRLRVTVWTRADSTWERGSSVTLQTDKLSWPVDLPLLPSRSEHESAEVELVVEALSGTSVLAETRVLSRFVPNERRLLRTTLSLCAGHAPGFVCATPECHGDACSVCAAGGECVAVRSVAGEPASLDPGAPGTGDGRRDASTGDGKNDGAGPTPDAGVVAVGDAGGTEPQSDASVVDAGSAPGVCPVDHGCKAPYPCVPTTLGYTCLGQMADWPMPDGFAFTKFKQSYTSDGVTVVDNVTKLEWQTNVPEVHAGCTHFSESYVGGSNVTVMGPVGEWCSLPEARKHCAELVVSGKDDWRLPSMIELASLLDHSRIDYRNGINELYFPDIEWSSYVSNSLYANGAASYRSVDVIQRSTWAGTEGEVRCVRAGSEPPFAKPSERYSVDLATDTVTDNATKLIWQRKHSASAFLSDAPALDSYCRDGFRLPTPNELLSLVDPTRENPALDNVAFPNTPSSKFWAVENGRGGAVSFAQGDMGIYIEEDAGYVRCVR